MSPRLLLKFRSFEFQSSNSLVIKFEIRTRHAYQTNWNKVVLSLEQRLSDELHKAVFSGS